MEIGDGRRKPSGCGLLTLLCQRHRRSSSTGSIPNRKVMQSLSPAHARQPSSSGRRGASHENATQLVVRSSLRQTATPAKQHPVLTPGNGLSGELDSMIFDFQRAKGSSNFVRASSGNVLVYGNLGNIRGNQDSINSALNTVSGGNLIGNVGNGSKDKNNESAQKVAPAVICRALARMEPEDLKEMGNEEYMKGRFAEALAVYDRAISLDADKASCRNNKAAALARMGRLMEAVGECREAVKINPSFCRAHYLLATLYLRLGEAEKAVHHFKLSQNEADQKDTARAKNLRTYIAKCTEARKLRDWKTLLKECQSAISIGVDSSPMVFASKAEALLRLGMHEVADSELQSAPKFDTDATISFFGANVGGYILMIQAQVDMASGRFEEAVAVSQRAAKVDQNNQEINAVVIRTRAVAASRYKGNEHFNASRYAEACIAYGEGLEHDPQNAILLCNRAACRLKLGEWEKAIHECNLALNLRPSYAKARRRRADCYAKLEKWEASVEDYEALIREIPGDEELMKAFLVVQSHLQRKHGALTDVSR